MSHFSKVKTKIVDLLHLKRALAEMELEVEEGAVKIRGYLGRKMKVDLKIRTPEGYDIGFVKAGDTYEVVADWEMVKSYTQESFVHAVTRRYATSVVKEQLQAQDYAVVQESTQGETLSLTLRRM
ncbi:MAG TPA: DUF1257 domain-containing protein [Deferrisomatales bacterium]|nr:DUF1257 domain-containing protein [Deferrisomatales bacterium]